MAADRLPLKGMDKSAQKALLECYFAIWICLMGISGMRYLEVVLLATEV